MPEIKISLPDSSDSIKEAVAAETLEDTNNEATTTGTNTPTQNGEVSTKSSSEAQSSVDVSSSSVVENGQMAPVKGKGKKVIKPTPVKESLAREARPKRSDQQLYKKWLDFGDDSDDTDEEDQTFEGPNGIFLTI